MALTVNIIGAGMGGLCLAQRLNASGVDVQVFERDSAPSARRQGYRLHLDADGVLAIRASLSDRQFALFEATSMVPLRYTTILDTDFSIKRRFVTDDYSKTHHHLASGIATHVNVNRSTLREILLLGLGDRVHYGKKLLRYDSQAKGVEVFFEDGGISRCDILVGADGAGSAVRMQRLPDAPWMDSGTRAIYGRLSLDVARQLLPGHALSDVFTGVSDSRKLILGAGPVIFPIRPDQAAAALASEYTLSPHEDYVGCIVAGRKEFFGDESTIHKFDSDALQRLAAQLIASWPARGSAVIEAAERGSFFFVQMSSSVPAPVEPPTNVTLLGDAIHTMTPSLGRGANVALRDADRLANAINRIQAGETPVAEGLAAYEHEMLAYGFGAVRHSAEMGARLLGQDPLPA